MATATNGLVTVVLRKKGASNPAELSVIVSHNDTETTRKCGLRGKIADAVASKKLKFSG
jgi:hypothetical protein